MCEKAASPLLWPPLPHQGHPRVKSVRADLEEHMACPHLPQKLWPGRPRMQSSALFSPSYRTLNKSLWPRGLHQPEPHPSLQPPWAHPSGLYSSASGSATPRKVRKGERKGPGRKKKEASLQHDVTPAALGSPRPQNRSKQHGLRSHCAWKVCVLGAPAACASCNQHGSQRGRRSLQPPGPI